MRSDSIAGQHHRIFYGWWIVGACFFVGFYTHGAASFGFTAVFEPIQREFGWSYAQISLAASLRGMESGILAPVVGLLVDRWGPRRLMVGGTIIFSLGLVVLSLVNSLVMFYFAFAIISTGMACIGSTILFAAVVNWFRRRLSVALSIVTSGFAFGGVMVPLVTVLVDALGWRTAMLTLGLGVLGTGLPLSLLVRHKPEQYGYQLDGDVESTMADPKGPAPLEGTEVSTPTKQILSSSSFWHIAPALTYQTLVMSAINTHMMPYLTTLNVRRAASSLIASAVPIISICGRLGFGWLGDRLDKRWLTALSFTMVGLGLLFYQIASVGLWFLVPFVILLGGGWGGSAVMRPALLREYFGRKTFGTVHGFVVGFMMMGQIAGAPLAGWVFDRWAAYQGIWLALAAAAVPATVAILATPRFERKPAHDA